jgi:hypothetical protein
MVEVSHPGYITKKFTISTLGIPKEKQEGKIKPIGATINLFKKIDGIDYSVLNQPMMRFSYNTLDETMEFDKAHQATMQAEIRKIEQAEAALLESQKDKEIQFASLVKDGDKALNKREFAKAITAYQEALKLKPKEIYPQTHLEGARKMQSDAEALA